MQEKQPNQKAGNPTAHTAAFQWLDSAQKPTWMSPLSVGIVGVFIGHNADDHPFPISYSKLGEMLRRSDDAVSTAVDELVANEWVDRELIPGFPYQFTLTGEHLKYLTSKVEVTLDAKAFTDWYLKRLQDNETDVNKWNLRRAKKKTLTMSHHINATAIVQTAGSLSKAKEMTEFALKAPAFRKRALKLLYELRKLINSTSFKAAFVTGVPIQEEAQETPQQKLARLLTDLRDAKDREKAAKKAARTAKSKDKPKADIAAEEQVIATQKMNDAAAIQAMAMGMNPEGVTFPDEIVNPMQYGTQFKEIHAQEASNDRR
jgi:hypothetical protein